MAAHARMRFKEAGYGDAYASYLDERRGVLQFDDGYEIDLSKRRLELTIDDILVLHALKRIPPMTSVDYNEAKANDTAKVVLNDIDKTQTTMISG